jgi:single-strand DNA-binding protein
MNNCIFTGNLTRDVETKYTQSGKCVANFTIACNRPSSNKNEKQVDYIAVVAWEKLGELCDTYLSKGKKALVEGRLQIREYENSAGVKKKIAEIIARNVEFLSSKSSSNERPVNTGSEYNNDGDIPDDDIPF